MKRRDGFLLVLMLVFVLGVWGCAKKQTVRPEEKIEEAEEQAEFIPEESVRGETFSETSELEDVFFGFDKYNVSVQSRTILNENAAWLADQENAYVQIEGHCDERGTVEYNLALGQRRATGVRNYLIKLGVDPKRISSISYGEEKPFDSSSDEDAWAKNRRAHFLVRFE
ncbi:peptidoglycan-associated lipoprotein Pal [bacterium]|nr:peptidoglycan-associated lipoprotein Pal [bacterium]